VRHLVAKPLQVSQGDTQDSQV